MTPKNEISAKFFDSARQEILERVRLRDQALFFYITATGAYFVFALKEVYQSHEHGLLQLAMTLPLPFLCLVSTLIVLNHHRLIGDLGAYIRDEVHFDPVEGAAVLPWNQSRTFLDTTRSAIDLRFWAQMLVLVLPLGYGIVLASGFLAPAASDAGLFALVIVNLFLDVATGVLIVAMHIAIKRRRSREAKPAG